MKGGFLQLSWHFFTLTSVSAYALFTLAWLTYTTLYSCSTLPHLTHTLFTGISPAATPQLTFLKVMSISLNRRSDSCWPSSAWLDCPARSCHVLLNTSLSCWHSSSSSSSSRRKRSRPAFQPDSQTIQPIRSGHNGNSRYHTLLWTPLFVLCLAPPPSDIM